MADYDSSLPIRTEAAGDVDVFISDSTTPSQKLKVNADGSIDAHLFDEAGVAFSAANPLPVIMASDAEGDEICNYNTSANVASDASVNHDYSVSTGKTLLIEQVWASASGKIKAEFQVDGVTKFVGFNSTANANIEIPVKKLLKGLSAQTVRVIITNLDKQAMDVYSTVSGLEI